AAAAEPEVKKEQTEFELKLDSFDAATKLKVIKEVRVASGLGLKESKDLVEGAPATIKGGLTKEDAEKFKGLIEAAGGKASI
ncbi:ribosomal protein L7/L12, partial [Baffinella frigidus]